MRQEFEILSGGREDDDELRSLRVWLREDPELRGAFIWEVDRDEPETMAGGVLEAVHVIVTDAATLGSFVLSLAAWLGTRPGRSWRIRRNGQDGELPASAHSEQVRAALMVGARDAEDAGFAGADESADTGPEICQ